MPRDTKRIEQLLANAKASRNLVREEIKAGSSLQHIYDELGGQEQLFSTRLKELREFNKKEAETAAKAKQAEEIAKARAELEKLSDEDLKKTAVGNKAMIEIKADTKREEIIVAILATYKP